MSQTVVPPAPARRPAPSAMPTGPAGPDGTMPAPGTLGARLVSAAATIRHYLAGSPGRLRIVSALAVLAAVLVALGGGAALRERSGALDEAKDAAAHLVVLQRVQTNLLKADADVTNAFLWFGLEPVKQQRDFIDQTQAASRDLALAANASPQDAAALGRVNADLARYMEYIGRARVNNTVGKPVGANYLNTASDLLRTDVTDEAGGTVRKSMITELEERSDADTQKVESAYARAARASWWLALVAIIGLGVLVWVQFFLARHFRRIFNVPLMAATAGLLVALIVAAGAMSLAQSRANDIRNGALERATNLSESRVGAFNAKSAESLSLITRGAGAEYEPLWLESFGGAEESLPAQSDDARAALTEYKKKHEEIRQYDDDGLWLDAVNKAISADPNSANAKFELYDRTTSEALARQAAETTSGLEKAGSFLLPAGLLVLLVGLLAAVGAWWGISLRLDEYR